VRNRIAIIAAILATPFLLRMVFDAAGGDNWETSPLRTALVPLADLFLRTFNSPAVGIVLSAIMLLLALVFTAAFLLSKSRRVARDLEGARAALAEPPRHGVSPLEHARAAFLATPIVARALEHSVSAVRPVLDRTASAAFERRLRLSDFDRMGLSFGFYRQLPDFFVAAGLVLTFCGLVAGLFFASRGLMTADITLARESLNRLLAASTLKFMTSVAGVGGALMLSIAYRAGLDRMERARLELLLAVDAIVDATDRRDEA